MTRSHAYGSSEPPKYLEIPSYSLDLDLPPRQRWKHIIANFPNFHSMIISLVSQILDSEAPKIAHPVIRILMSTILTKLASEELTEELQGISEVSGCPVWALVAYNIGYDFMAGCTSGGIKTIGEDGKEEMFHYRNLDWHMEETRQTTIKVNYIRGGKTIMEAIHYAGLVGVHTGVRQGLSVSLNFRAHTNETTSFYTTLQQAFGTALGNRPDACAIIRDMLIQPTLDFDTVVEKLQTMNTAPAFFILCSPDKTAILEKDYTSAKVLMDDKFLACANHDQRVEDWAQEEFHEWAASAKDPLLMSTLDRKQCAVESSHRVKSVRDLKTLTQTWPVLNTLTTFGVIMSPERGTIDWEAWYKEAPIPPPGMENWGGEFTPTPLS